MTSTDTYALGEPFCAACGHRLTGCIDSARCPECGRPIVEVLTRRSVRGTRYRAQTTLMGLPIIDIAYGPTDTEAYGHARGVFAIGDRATGIVAMGGRAIGVVAMGGMAVGVVSVGGLSFGLLSAWGGLAMGLSASGGMALGLLASGGLAIGLMSHGGVAVGYWALGGAPLGVETNNLAVQDAMSRFSLFFGTSGGFTVRSLVQPIGFVFAAGAIVAAIFGGLSTIAHIAAGRKQRGTGEP